MFFLSQVIDCGLIAIPYNGFIIISFIDFHPFYTYDWIQRIKRTRILTIVYRNEYYSVFYGYTYDFSKISLISWLEASFLTLKVMAVNELYRIGALRRMPWDYEPAILFICHILDGGAGLGNDFVQQPIKVWSILRCPWRQHGFSLGIISGPSMASKAWTINLYAYALYRRNAPMHRSQHVESPFSGRLPHTSWIVREEWIP